MTLNVCLTHAQSLECESQTIHLDYVFINFPLSSFCTTKEKAGVPTCWQNGKYSHHAWLQIKHATYQMETLPLCVCVVLCAHALNIHESMWL